jgi:hypothetical protein
MTIIATCSLFFVARKLLPLVRRVACLAIVIIATIAIFIIVRSLCIAIPIVQQRLGDSINGQLEKLDTRISSLSKMNMNYPALPQIFTQLPTTNAITIVVIILTFLFLCVSLFRTLWEARTTPPMFAPSSLAKSVMFTSKTFDL